MTPEPDDAALVALGRLVREHAAASVSPEVEQRGKAALTHRLRSEANGPSRRVRPVLALGGAVALAAAVALLAFRLRPLSYEVRGARSDGPYISAPSTSPVTVTFGDGSAIEAAPGARLRVDEPRVAGARVLVERGRATVHVQHRTGSAWNFVAGPFDVHVTGTRFELGWDPSGESVDLRLDEGSVEVRGPFAEAPIAVRAGQRFRADLRTRSMTVSELGAERAALPAASAGAQPANEAAEPEPEPAPVMPTPPEASPGRTVEPSARPAPAPLPTAPWSELVARGQFETVLAKASERGTEDCEASCSAGDLRALADAARYTGRNALAEGALKALRARFGSTKEGRTAAFLLGRLYEARGSMSQADRFYDTYLRESPAGDLAAEALAGRMRSALALSGKAAAEPIARKYLSLYPNGVHAQTARGIVAGTPHP